MDEIDCESGAVQAVAIFYPVTDFLNMNGSTEDSGGKGPPLSFVEAFESDATDPEKWKDIGRKTSPLFFINEKLPPVLIYHGDADTFHWIRPNVFVSVQELLAERSRLLCIEGEAMDGERCILTL